MYFVVRTLAGSQTGGVCCPTVLLFINQYPTPLPGGICDLVKLFKGLLYELISNSPALPSSPCDEEACVRALGSQGPE